MTVSDSADGKNGAAPKRPRSVPKNLSSPSEQASRPVLWDEADMLRRLRRVEGQIRGLEAMVTRQDSCRAILTQVAAAEGALAQVRRLVAACSVVESLGEILPIEDAAAVREQLRQAASNT
jgi:DNA-binding FrmR family transcriptional regulator